MQKHPLQNKLFSFKNVTLVLIVLITLKVANAQNSIVGDGFGGRLWYKPYNYTVGAYSAYTICGDTNQLFGWGGNEYGQLGDGTNTGNATPTRVIGMTQVHYYSTGYLMGAIRYDKSGWVWGHLAGNKPVKVLDKVKFLDAGMDVVTFIKSDGTVWSVGSNLNGSFGNNEINENSTLIPQQMVGIKNAVRVANSGSNNTILLADGTVMQAGRNFYFSTTLTPQKIKGLENIVDIKANQSNALALDKYGNVYAWGSGMNGSNGNGTIKDNKTPQLITGLRNIVAISGCNDGDHFLALDSNHNCYAWGFNGYGQGGTTESRLYTPKLVATNVNDIMAGERFSYIIKTDGELYASGMSKDGSIWMNLQNKIRFQFTKINPRIPPIELCEPTRKEPFILKPLLIKICPGDSFSIGKHHYKIAGRFNDTIFSNYGLDTIITTHLSFNKVSTHSQIISICEGDFFRVAKHLYYNVGIYKDTFKNAIGCDSILTTEIKHRPVSHVTQTAAICEGEQIKIGRKTYLFTGIYHDTFTNIFGCDSILTIDILVNKNPLADFEFGTPFIETGDTFRLLNASTGANQFNWRFDFPFADSSTEVYPFYRYTKKGTKAVRLIATNRQTQCRDTMMKTISINDNETIFIPNAFHPDGNGENDYFKPITKRDKNITMQIFNRWGLLIFETSDYEIGWDGMYKHQNCPQDVYVYTIECRDSLQMNAKHFSGTFTLLR
jgi:gliding motility-associated-like protein